MPQVHFKRYRMSYALDSRNSAWQLPVPHLPPGYRWLAWRNGLSDAHAEVKFQSFQHEVDANVFPCFSSRSSCQRLMRDISRREGFLPQATWLILPPDQEDEFGCGTIQGIATDLEAGNIQNLGVTPQHRGLGLGTALLAKALEGFAQVGLKTAVLEVTSDNFGAVRLYQRLGWEIVKVVYKTAEVSTHEA